MGVCWNVSGSGGEVWRVRWRDWSWGLHSLGEEAIEQSGRAGSDAPILSSQRQELEETVGGMGGSFMMLLLCWKKISRMEERGKRRLLHFCCMVLLSAALQFPYHAAGQHTLHGGPVEVGWVKLGLLFSESISPYLQSIFFTLQIDKIWTEEETNKMDESALMTGESNRCVVSFQICMKSQLQQNACSNIGTLIKYY